MCDDSPVDIINVDPPRALPVRRRRLTLRDLAAGLLVVGFGLVVASQWVGWFSIQEETFDAADSHIPASFGMADTPSFLQVPYYLVWLAVFAFGGAVVFAPRMRRMAWFGAAAGALATQVIIVVPVLRKPAIIIDGIVGDFSVVVHARHTAGSYLVIASIAVIAVAMVVAVTSRPGTLEVAAPDQLTMPEPGADLSKLMEAETTAIDFGRRDSEPVLPAEPIEIVAPRPDHSMYVRPTMQS